MIESWGGIRSSANEVLGEKLVAIGADQPLARGLGRSYGDASLPGAEASSVLGTRLADRVLELDEERLVLRAEAGIDLATLNRLLWPRNLTVPVVPGTQFVTLGGMVAADVHGKNHHGSGTFGRWVEELLLLLADGRTVRCSRSDRADLFRASVGGMGLTGHILEVAFRVERIPSPWIQAEAERVPDLAAVVDGLRAASEDWPFTVAWVDTLYAGRRRSRSGAREGMGRGVVFRGRWARAGEAPEKIPEPRGRLSVPFRLPSGLLNRWSARAFNAAVYRLRPSGVVRRLQHPESFFHPLDNVLRWNRVYGKRGMTQYQCVIPTEAGDEGWKRFFRTVVAEGVISFLTVFKELGAEGDGTLSFPRPGITINLDLPIENRTSALVARLNEELIELGGRIYLAKDLFTTERHYRAMEPRLDRFRRELERFDPDGRLGSRLSERVGVRASKKEGDGP